MKARIVLSFILMIFLSAGGPFTMNVFAGGPVVTKVACTEYQAAWLYSDGSARSFIYNSTSGHVEFTPFVVGGRKVVDVSTGFNRITLLDDQGYVWLNDAGKSSAVRWEKDATGAVFNGNVSIYGYFFTYLSIRSDGTIWYWGGDDYKFYGGTTVAAPVKINQPAGVKFVKLATGNVILGLTSTGDVYQWSKGSTNYVKVTLPRPASDVAASHNDFFVAVVPDNIATSTAGYPYCWGSESRFWGGDGTSYPSTAPVAVKSLWNMPYPIKKITANHNVIHYIDTNGDLYGIGDNPNGEIGNGQEKVNHAETYPTPYAWSWTKYEMLTGAPAVHVASGTKFKDLFTGNTYAFYHYALDVNDSLYFWGRNKSFVGGDGAVNNQEATYPNALDVLKPTRRTPLGVAPTQTAGYDFKMYTLKGIAKQTVILPLATLSAVATPSLLTSAGRANYGYSISKIQWTKVSGPASYTITLPNSLITTVTGLTNGTYVFAVQTTDNNTGTITAYDTVVVNNIASTQPATPTLVADAGADASITLPTSTYTITGTATVKNETVSSCKWTQVSGPNTAVISGSGSITPTVSGLIQGSYVFRVTLTGASGLSSVDQMTLTVNAAPTNITFIASAGPDASIVLPTNSYKIAGVATVKNETVSTCRWTQVSGPGTATITGGGSITPTVSGLVQGSYVFQVALVGKTGVSSSDQMTLAVKASGSSALTDSTVVTASSAVIIDSAVVTNLKAYPNPVAADQSITVDGQTDQQGRINFMIYDISGRLVKQVATENLSAYFHQTIGLRGLVRGVYVLRVQSDGKKKAVTLSFLIQ